MTTKDEKERRKELRKDQVARLDANTTLLVDCLFNAEISVSSLLEKPGVIARVGEKFEAITSMGVLLFEKTMEQEDGMCSSVKRMLAHVDGLQEQQKKVKEEEAKLWEELKFSPVPEPPPFFDASNEQPEDALHGNASPESEDIPISPPIAISLFEKQLLPYFDRLGWQVRFRTQPDKEYMVIDSIIVDGKASTPEVARELLLQVLGNNGTHSPPGKPQVKSEGVPPESMAEMLEAAFRGMAKLVHLYPGMQHEKAEKQGAEAASAWQEPLDVDQFKAQERGPEFLKLYAEQAITVTGADMIAKVKDGFSHNGWIYTGEQYGNGDVVLSVVVDKDNQVVDPKWVKDALSALGVTFKYKSPTEGSADEEDFIDEEEAIDETAEGVLRGQAAI